MLSGCPPLAAWIGLLFGTLCFSFSIVAAAEPTGPVVFIGPASPQLDAALHDALTAQLSGASMPLEFSRFPRDDLPLRDQVATSRRLSVERRALGVFWVDAHVQNDWQVYLLADGAAMRVLVRHIAVEQSATDAATEAVAVIIRESSEALRTGQALAMQPVYIAPEEPPQPPPPPPPKPAEEPLGRYRGFSLFVGYRGDRFAEDRSHWQHGMRVAAAWRHGSGFYLGGGFGLLRDVTVQSGDLTFQLGRTPLDGFVGYARPFGRLVPAVEVRALAELVSRDNLSTGGALEATEGGTRVMAFFSPRLRLDFALTRTLSLGVAGGIDVMLNHFSFVSREDGSDRVLIEPLSPRPSIEVGITVWP